MIGDLLEAVRCCRDKRCSDCPMQLEIPKIIAAHNSLKNGDFMAYYDMDADPAMDPRRCVGCGACAAICPQHIDIPDIMNRVAERLSQPMFPR